MSMQTYLRLLVNGDKEAVASAISAQDTETTLTSKLTSYQRKFLTLYNNSPSGSGEAYYGFTSGELSIKNGMVLKKGEYHTVPWARTYKDQSDDSITTLYLGLIAESGEQADIRVVEIG